MALKPFMRVTKTYNRGVLETDRIEFSETSDFREITDYGQQEQLPWSDTDTEEGQSNQSWLPE